MATVSTANTVENPGAVSWLPPQPPAFFIPFVDIGNDMLDLFDDLKLATYNDCGRIAKAGASALSKLGGGEKIRALETQLQNSDRTLKSAVRVQEGWLAEAEQELEKAYQLIESQKCDLSRLQAKLESSQEQCEVLKALHGEGERDAAERIEELQCKLRRIRSAGQDEVCRLRSEVCSLISEKNDEAQKHEDEAKCAERQYKDALSLNNKRFGELLKVEREKLATARQEMHASFSAQLERMQRDYVEEHERSMRLCNEHWQAKWKQDLQTLSDTKEREISAKMEQSAALMQQHKKVVRATEGAQRAELKNAWDNAQFFHDKLKAAERRLHSAQAANEGWHDVDGAEAEDAVKNEEATRYVCLGAEECENEACFCRHQTELEATTQPAAALLEGGEEEDDGYETWSNISVATVDIRRIYESDFGDYEGCELSSMGDSSESGSEYRTDSVSDLDINIHV